MISSSTWDGRPRRRTAGTTTAPVARTERPTPADHAAWSSACDRQVGNGRFSPLAPKPEWRGSYEEATVIETEGLTHIHLLVSDLERSLRFYNGAFGLEEQFRDGPSMVFLRTPGSRDTITINEDPARMDRVGRGGVDHFGFRLRPDVDLDAAITDVVAAGGRLVEQGEHAPGVPYAYVEDPDGYLIEL
jgi:catechol 2,3-dioxygenase-like lactoylglutathione lyase family enzyme